MVEHGWMLSVLGDLADYCSKNELKETQFLVQAAKQILEKESRAMAPSEMTLENHLAQASQQPTRI